MLKIHKPFSKHKLLLIPITSICIISGLLGLYTLTYTPELSHAETVDNVDRRTMDDITYMQDITPDICQNSELNKQYTLVDRRDESDYTIARIKNQTDDESNCWMTQNIHILDKKISYLDSDMQDGEFIIPAPTSTSTDFNIDHQHGPMAYYYHDYYYGDNYYYNWYTATAGSSIFVDKNINSGNATSSICPKNWQIPSREQLVAFTTDLTESAISSSPYYFKRTGFVSNDGLWYNRDYGRYWSSSYNFVYSGVDYLHFSSGSVYLSNAEPDYYGLSFRCITRSDIPDNYNNVAINVNHAISLDVTNEVEVKKSNTNPSTAAFSALVASNQPYSVSISSASPSLSSSTSSTTIPSKSGLLNTNENAWGIKLSAASTYTQITTTPKLFYSSTTPESKAIPFTIGISTAEDLPAGEYSTNITVTATQN